MNDPKKKAEPKYHKYFKNHECHLPADKYSVYGKNCGRFRRFFLDLTTARSGDIRAQNMYQSYAALCSEKYRQYRYYPFSIHPFSKLRIYSEALFIIAMLVTNTLLSLHFSEPVPKHMDWHNIILCAFDVLYFITSILINFFSGYIEGNTSQYVVLNLRKVWSRYATTWLISDLMAAFCLLPIFLMDERYMLLHTLFSSMKLLRLPSLIIYLGNVMTVMRAGLYQRTLIQTSILMYFYITWNIYFQFIVEYIKEGSYQPENPRNCSWMTIANLWNSTAKTRLIYSLDRAVGMLRKNTNIHLIMKNGCFENFFVISWLIAQILIYHCVLTYIIALIGSESAKAKYYIMTKQVENYMNTRKFPPRIKQKIRKFYAIRYQSFYCSESKMLACVTGQLREDIIMHTGRQLVRELVFLKQLPRSLLLQIGLKLKVVIFIAGDIIFKINTFGDCIYFIDKGTVAIYSESGNEICHLEDGDFFGEISLVMKNCLRTASVVAVTNCELFRLDKEEFDNSIACYPTVYETIKKVAINRFEKTCILDEHHKTELSQRQVDQESHSSNDYNPND